MLVSHFSEDFSFKTGVKNDFSNQFGIFRLWETWITSDELYKLFGRMLLCWEATEMFF